MSSFAKTLQRVEDLVLLRNRSPRQFLAVIFFFALLLRMALILLRRTYHITDYGDDLFSFGWEMGRVGRSLALGNGFSSPMPAPTGPTAIVGPVYPLILAGIFKVFGVYTTAAAFATLTLQSIFSSLTCIFVYLCGRDSMNEAAGRLAALLWAIFPLNIFFATTKIWESSITALLAAALFWYLLSIRDSLSVARWAGAGALLAVATLLNTSLTVLMLPFGFSALARKKARFLLPATVGALMWIAVISPWMIRNHAVFGKFVLRSNFPLEFRVCNNEMSPGQKLEDMHPAKAPYLNQRWHDIGEMRFMDEQRALNAKYMTRESGLFAFSIVNRVVNYWTGVWIMPTLDFPNELSLILSISMVSLFGWLGVRGMIYQHNPAGLMYAACLILYPVVYYLTTSQPRFYHSITPLLVAPAACWLLSWKDNLGVTETGQLRSLQNHPDRAEKSVESVVM